MTRVLKSNHIVAVRFPALPVLDAEGRELRDDDGNLRIRVPEVVLPRGSHTPRERQAGALAYIELTDEQQARLRDDELFRRMVKAGSYSWTEFSRIPIELLPGDQQRDAKVNALEKENALLRNELRKHDLAVPVFNPGPQPVPSEDGASLAQTNVSIPAAELEPVGPRFGADTRVTLPGADGGSPFPH